MLDMSLHEMSGVFNGRWYASWCVCHELLLIITGRNKNAAATVMSAQATATVLIRILADGEAVYPPASKVVNSLPS